MIVRRCTAWHCVYVKHTTVKMYDIVCFTTTKIHISKVCNETLHIHGKVQVGLNFRVKQQEPQYMVSVK